MLTNIIIILLLVIFIIGLSCLLNKKNPDVEMIFKHIEEGTVFHFITKPEITCKINHIRWKDYINPRMFLTVTYPSGKQVELLTTLNEFKKLWRELEY